MATDYDRLGGESRRSRPFLRALIIVAIGFVGGLVAMGYALTHWDGAAAFIKGRKPPPPLVAAPPMRIAPPRVIVTPAPAPDALSSRIAAIESRISDVDARASAASGNADRAEGLLVAFAARRALDRGAALGYIESLLRERFGATDPQAVATIISAGRQPVTLEELRAGLEHVGPTLAGPGPDESWLDGLRRELAGLIVVRHAGTPSAAPADRLTRARNLVETGQVEAALAEVARMPGRDAAADWIAAARRYTLARGALDRIETVALLQPREARVAAPIARQVPAVSKP